MPSFRMNFRGSAEGAVTGRRYRFARGDILTAPEGEFAHLSEEHCEMTGDYPTTSHAGDYETRPMSARTPTYSLGAHKAGGWYYLLKGGERVPREEGDGFQTVGQGKEAAQDQIDSLNNTVS